MRNAIPALLLPIVILLSMPVAAASGVWEPTPADCRAPAEFETPDKVFPHLARSIHHDVPVEFLAVGSGTTVGQDGGGGHAFPFRMVEVLRVALPEHEIHLTIRGARGLSAEQMVTLMQQELKEKRFSLVLWQTGAVEAAHGASPEELGATLAAGIAMVRAAGSDLVLIDMQYNRFLKNKVDFAPYLEMLKQAANVPDVALFRRYDLTQFWVDAGHHDLEHVKKADQETAVDALHTCLGISLARFIARGAGLPVPTPAP